MKRSKSKYLTLAGLVLGTGVLLSACGNSSTAGVKNIQLCLFK